MRITDPALTPRLPARMGKAADLIYKTASDHAMVALRIPVHVAQQIAIKGGEPVANLHCTLVYLGDVAEINPDNLRSLCDEWLPAVGNVTPPLEGRIAGYGRFAPNEDEDVIWAGLDAPDLAELRHMVLTAVQNAGIIPVADHGFTPHITLAYVEPGEGEDSMPPNVDVEIRYLSVTVGDQEIMIPLKGERPIPAVQPVLSADTFSDLQGPSVEFTRARDLERWAQNQGSLMVRADTPGMGAVIVKKGTDIAIGLEAWDGNVQLADLLGALGAINHDFIMVGRLAAWDAAVEEWVDGPDMAPVLLAERVAAPVFFASDLLVLDRDISRQPARERFERLRVLVAPAGGAVCVPLQIEATPMMDLSDVVDEVAEWQPAGREGGWYCPGVTVVGADSPYAHGTSEHEVRLVLRVRKGEGIIGIGAGGGVTEKPVDIIDDRMRLPNFPDIRPIAATKRAGYNPNQPRDPGGEGGGQWVGAGGGADQDPVVSEFLKKLDADPKIQAARKAIKETIETIKVHKKGGEWTPERQALHEKIVAEMLDDDASVPEGQTPTATFVIGLPASGKSGVLKPTIANLDKATTIDPDAVKEKLPEYNGKNAGAVHAESGEIAEGPLLAAALEKRHNLVFDLVGKNKAKLLELTTELKSAGYAVDLRHVTLPPIEAAKRALTRYDEMGRFVDPSYILNDVGHRSDETYEALKNSGAVRSWESYDNSGPFGSKPTLREHGGSAGRVSRGADGRGYDQEVSEGEGVWKDGVAGGTFGTAGTHGILAPQQGMFKKPKRSRHVNKGEIRTDLTLLKVGWTDEARAAALEARRGGVGTVAGEDWQYPNPMGDMAEYDPTPNDEPRVRLKPSIWHPRKWMDGDSFSVGYGVVGGHTFRCGTLKDGQFVPDKKQPRVNPYEAIFQRKGVLLGLGTVSKSALDQAQQDRDLREQQQHDQAMMVGALVAMSEAGVPEGVQMAIITKVGWTDEARAKALETRRRNAANKVKPVATPTIERPSTVGGPNEFKVSMRDASGETLVAPDGQVYSGGPHARMSASVGHSTDSSLRNGYVRGRVEDGVLSVELDMDNDQTRANAKALVSAHGKDSNVYVDHMWASKLGTGGKVPETAVFENPGAIGKALRFIDSKGEDRSETKAGARVSHYAKAEITKEVAFDETKHPRAEDGKWTDGSQATKPPKMPDSLTQPSLPGMEGAGRTWEPENDADKVRQLYLEEESRAAIGLAQKDWDDLVGEEITVTGKGGWDGLSDDDKSEYQNQWENDNVEEYINEAEKEWQDSSEASSKKAEAASEQFYDKISDQDLDAAVREAIKGTGAFSGSDAAREYFLDNMEANRFFQMGEAEDDRELSKAFDEVMEGYTPEDESEEKPEFDTGSFSGEIRSQYETMLERVAEDIEVEPDESEKESIHQDAYEKVSEAFHNLSSDDLDSLVGDSTKEETFTVEEPKQWLLEKPEFQPYPADKPGASQEESEKDRSAHMKIQRQREADYEATRQAAQALVGKRAEALWRERNPVPEGKEESDYMPDFHVIGDEFWNDWKRDSNATGTRAMQNALIKELGVNSLGRQGDEEPSGAQQVYAKALWQTTQFVLHKADMKEVNAYRAIMVDGDKLKAEHTATEHAVGGERTQDPDRKWNDDTKLWEETPKPNLPPKTFSEFTDLPLKQATAQSFTFDKSVANSWGGVGKQPPNPHRIVLRATVPPEAVWSLPVYGKNLQNENEVVMLGTPWKTWEAWDTFAPDFEELPMKRIQVSETPTIEKPKKPESGA